jgi:hypothetical protein
MTKEILQLELEYEQRVDAAHEAFRQNNWHRLTELYLCQGGIASEIYHITGSEFWDMRAYSSFNAAGGAFDRVGEFKAAGYCYSLALKSCERIAESRSPEWQKNIDHLKFLVNQAKSNPESGIVNY